MLDEPRALVKKVKSAVTDTGREVVFDVEGKPGISNLMTILAVATDTDVEKVQAEFDGTGYGTDGFGWSSALTIDFIERQPRSERDRLEERLRAAATASG